MRKRIIPIVIVEIIIAALLILTFSIFWCHRVFGSIGMEEILFTLNTSKESTDAETIGSFVLQVLLPAGIILIAQILILIRLLKKKGAEASSKKGGALCVAVLLVWCVCIAFIGNAKFGLFTFVKNTLSQSTFIEKEYVDASKVNIRQGEKKKNLIYIFLESAETSLQDKKNGGMMDKNLIPEMTELAKENLTFTESDETQMKGAAVAPACGWTSAGIVAETTGLPLKLFAYGDHKGGADNAGMENVDQFMPGATSMGEILKDAGYHNYLIVGSSLNFGGKRMYFEQHGDYTAYDYNYAIKQGWIPKGYHVSWGIEDKKLYSYAKQKLTEISKKDEPFNFTIETIDTHLQGFECDSCPKGFDNKYEKVWACASKQVADFVAWCKTQPFYEDSVIVICGDHCAMNPDYFDEKGMTYEKHHGEHERKVYQVFINSDVKPEKRTNRKFTTLDIFPTTLGALGFEIEGDKLGLGTNLFSGTETLAEKYGYDKMFEELDKKSVFYNEKILYVK